MTQSKHTPGPWLRDRESGFDCDVRSSGGRKIASVNVQSQPKSKDGWIKRKEENEANACLIAAAPELYELVFDALHGDGDAEEWKDKARAAIAKATGA